MVSSSNNPLDTFIKRLLRPLISLFIKNNVLFRSLCELVKEVYVDIAATEYGKGGRPTNITRIALLTGIDRKEVKRIRDNAETPTQIETKTQSGSLGRVLSAWFQDDEFSTNGEPNALDIDGAFSRLCKKYGGDITRTAILNELIRVEAVHKLPDGSVEAINRYYMPQKADQEAIVRSLDVYFDLGSTLTHNLYRQENEPSRFEGRASNASIPASQVQAFKTFIEQKGQEFLEEIDQQLSDSERPDAIEEERVRLGVGLYLIENNLESSSVS